MSMATLSTTDYWPSEELWQAPALTSVQPPEATLSGIKSEEQVFQLCAERSLLGAPAWLDQALEQLNRLLDLPENWDSYGAKPLDAEPVAQALQLLAEVMQDQTPPPQIVPTVHGSLQLEWHTAGIDLEVELLPEAELLVSFEDTEAGEEWEGRLSGDLGILPRILWRLTSRKAKS